MNTGHVLDGTAHLRLRALSGLLAGEAVQLTVGRSLLVGRSRRCHFSLRKSRAFRSSNEAEQLHTLDDPTFLKVSRVHLRIKFTDENTVEIQDLSQNGTWVDGQKVKRLVRNLDEGEEIEIRISEADRFVLSRETARL